MKKAFVVILGLTVILFATMLFAGETAPGTVILKGAPMGGVKFDHPAHVKVAKCADCHHANKAEKPLATPHQKCQDCHTSKVVAPVKSDAKTALHANCIDCHKKVAKGPTKCTECHQKGNV
ncbi:MAG TPA: cytochrome c3 family protein [Clostridia bacterium]|nr:cytochrome c3 family protein [Clostridia bacterium]